MPHLRRAIYSVDNSSPRWGWVGLRNLPSKVPLVLALQTIFAWNRFCIRSAQIRIKCVWRRRDSGKTNFLLLSLSLHQKRLVSKKNAEEWPLDSETLEPPSFCSNVSQISRILYSRYKSALIPSLSVISALLFLLLPSWETVVVAADSFPIWIQKGDYQDSSESPP